MKQSDPVVPPGRERVDELLYRSLRAVYHYERRLEARFGLDFQEIYLLQLLRRHGAMRVGAAGQLLEAPKFEATRLAQKLEGLGLVEKAQSEGDGRAVIVCMSAAGRSALEAIEAFNYTVVCDPAPGAEADFGALLAAASSLEALFGAPAEIEAPEA